MKIRRTETIGVRVDPLTKNLLQQIADSEKLDLSDIARRAIEELVRKQASAFSPNRPPTAHVQA